MTTHKPPYRCDVLLLFYREGKTSFLAWVILVLVILLCKKKKTKWNFKEGFAVFLSPYFKTRTFHKNKCFQTLDQCEVNTPLSSVLLPLHSPKQPHNFIRSKTWHVAYATIQQQQELLKKMKMNLRSLENLSRVN